MAYFAMGDLHFSGNPPKKPMDIFNENWKDHQAKIINSWRSNITEKDTVFLLGDISWAINLDEALEDLNLIASMPGQKIMIRGNHDFWWVSKNKMCKATDNKINFMQAQAMELEDCVVGGTRGYLCPGDSQYSPTNDDNIYRRETIRLELALEEMTKVQDKTKIVLLHYPPLNEVNQETAFTELLQKYEVDHCLFGHLHTFSDLDWLPPNIGKTKLHLVSSNYLDFKFKKITL